MFRGLINRQLRRFGYEIVPSAGRQLSATEVQAKLVPAATVIFDVGASVGNTVRQYRAAFPAARIYAFEPFPASYATLAAAASGDRNVQPMNVALSDEEGQTTFHCNTSPLTNSLLPNDERGVGTWGEGVAPRFETVVPVTTLDAFCAKARIDRIDILKIDVQGAETRVLRGARGMLGGGCVGCVFIEILIAPTYRGQASEHEIFQSLCEFGFRLHDVCGLLYGVDGSLGQFDAVFVHRDAVDRSLSG